MTIHSSLRGVNTLTGERSVLSRVERIQKLSKDGKFDPAKNAVWGLPKVRTRFKVAGAKKAPKAAAAEGTPEGEAPAAAPETPAKPAGKEKAGKEKAPAKGKK